MRLTVPLPRALEDLRRWLLAEGFKVSHVRVVRSFGDCLVEFERGPVRVRFIRDRGSWEILIGGCASGTWFDTALWKAALTGVEALQPASSLEQRAKIMKEMLPLVRGALADPSIDTRLEELARERALRALGISGS